MSEMKPYWETRLWLMNLVWYAINGESSQKLCQNGVFVEEKPTEEDRYWERKRREQRKEDEHHLEMVREAERE